jgi:hypothetical protein
MSIDEREPRLAPSLVELLDRVRRRIRSYVLVEGTAATIAALAVAFWTLLAIDWLFEFPREVRLVLLLVAGAVVGLVVWRVMLGRLIVRLPDRSMAILLERQFPFDDSLLTAVEMTERHEVVDSYSRDMLAHTCDLAEHRAQDIQVDRIFNPTPLMLAIACALITGGGLLAFAATFPDAFRFGAARIVTATNDLWPRATRLEIDGFPNGEAVVAKGGELKLVVRADTKMTVPDKVQVRYQTEDGVRERKFMVRVGVAREGVDDYQNFEYLFTNLLSPVKLEVRGGDARLSDLRIRVVESPTSAISLNCQYPEYMHLAARDIPAAAVTPLPQGCRVTLRAAANKDLVRAEVEELSGKGPATLHQLKPAAGDRRALEFVLPSLLADTTLRFALFDTDGVTNRDTIQLTLVSVPDTPPQVAVQLTGIGSAITVNARLPFVGEVRDDYGVAKSWYAYTVDETDPKQVTLTAPAQPSVDLHVDASFEVRDLALKPEQKLLIGIEAVDNRQLPDDQGGPNFAQGQRYLLDVVTPEQLRAQLEARELNIRQRFESIIAEMTETRDSLTRIEPSTDDKVNEQNRLVTSRARQNGDKNAQETAGVAAAFDGIHQELVNNRIDTEELKLRLKDNIADPLHAIVRDRFPAFGKRLKELDDGLKGQRAADLHRLATAEADALVVELERVRDKMLELETFNEAIDLLRSILAAEKQVGEDIKKSRTNKVRKLLEE